MDGFANVSLSKLVRDLRVAKGWTSTQMAGAVGCAQSHIWNIENNELRGSRGSMPSEDLLRRISQACAASPDDEVKLRQRLLLARAREIVPTEIREYLSEEVMSPMPSAFLSRLRTDVATLSVEELGQVQERCRLHGRVSLVLNGLGRLSSLEVALLAKELGQSVDQYLYAAEYMSDGMKLLLQDYEGCISLLEVVAGFTEESRRELERFRDKVVGLGQGKQPIR